jgi:hypothetical protein
VPAASAGIQVNFCKNPVCGNFGVPVAATAIRGPGAVNLYSIAAAGKGFPVAHCHACGEYFPLKSNQGVHEEFCRIHSGTTGEATCPRLLCTNHWVSLSTPGAYQSFGSTPLGSRRYRCKACGVTFSMKPSGLNPIRNQQQSSKNLAILRMLVGKMPLRRICEAVDVTPPVLYQRIEFFHRQAIEFLAQREQKLPQLELRRLYVSVDRQNYAVNWTQRKDKRNVVLSAVAAADNGSGYVFGMHPNFDPECDPVLIEKEAVALGDLGLPAPHRRFARLWLQSDYASSVIASLKRAGAGSLACEIAATYTRAHERADVESPETFTLVDALPTKGMQVHAEYTLYGHFLHLKHLFAGVEKIRFFVDQDSGMRAACLGVFADRVKARSADAFYVRIAKELTVDEKRRRVREAETAFALLASRFPGRSEQEIKLALLKERISEAQSIGHWKDRWVFHPLPSMSEPEKAMCLLTDLDDYDADHLAWLFNKASLHAVDTWFNRIRRRSSLLERPISSSSNRYRVWNGYSAYRPEQVGKMLTILRACHNYVWASPETKQTPAMRLGLAKSPLDYKNLIYFS